MTTYRTRPGYFPDDDERAQQLERQYREAFDVLPADIQARLRDGHDDGYTPEQIDRLARGPHALVSLTYWIDRPEQGQWGVAHEFARWAEAQQRVD